MTSGSRPALACTAHTSGDVLLDASATCVGDADATEVLNVAVASRSTRRFTNLWFALLVFMPAPRSPWTESFSIIFIVKTRVFRGGVHSETPISSVCANGFVRTPLSCSSGSLREFPPTASCLLWQCVPILPPARCGNARMATKCSSRTGMPTWHACTWPTCRLNTVVKALGGVP